MDLMLRQAEVKDVPRIEQFLSRTNISSIAVSGIPEQFVLLEDEEGGIMATIGLEVRKPLGLLRSFVFTPAVPYEKIPSLIWLMLVLAKKLELEKVFLATDKSAALQLFEAGGFNKVEAGQLPAEFLSFSNGRQLLEKPNNLFMCRIV